MHNAGKPSQNADSSGESLRERLHGWRLAFSPDGESIAKGIVCAAVIVVFALTQTTLFPRILPFGAVPDLMLPLTVAAAMVFGEKWGAVFGLVSAFIIESLGGASVTILPILYMLTGYIIGLLSIYRFRDGFAVRILYTAATSLLRTAFTAAAVIISTDGVSPVFVIRSLLLPELAANLVFAILPHIASLIFFRPFSHERK